MIELRKDDIKAMKAADRVAIKLSDATGQFTLIKDIRQVNTGVFELEGNSHEARRTLQGAIGTTTEAWFYISYAKSCGQWQALCAIVRPGDQVELRARENNNNYLDAAEIPHGKLGEYHGRYEKLHHDECLVTIVRKDKRIVRDLLLVWSVCPDNTARAIKHDGRPAEAVA